MYAVHVDHPTNTAKIHKATCTWFKKRIPDGHDRYWRFGFKTYDEALNFANKSGKKHVSDCYFCFGKKRPIIKTKKREKKEVKSSKRLTVLKCPSCKANLKQKPPCECEFCGAPLKPSVKLFGESLPNFEIFQSRALSQKADVMLIAGSSLSVAPVCDLPLYTLRDKGKLIIVNDQPTHLDERADVVIHHKTGSILPLIVEEVKLLQESEKLKLL